MCISDNQIFKCLFGWSERRGAMSVFRCPICERKIGIFRKYWQSTLGNRIIECPSCKSKLRLKTYGSSYANAALIIIFSHWIFGVKGQSWLLYILEWLILTFFQKMFSPILPCEPDQKWKIPEWIIVTLLAIFVAVYILI